ncbi:MAG: hypothetical protein NUW12_09995 [Firmicutes bacterium]|nr:hypothetical protein [Bacillota bacterium]
MGTGITIHQGNRAAKGATGTVDGNSCPGVGLVGERQSMLDLRVAAASETLGGNVDG